MIMQTCLASSVDGSGDAQVRGVVELAGGDLALMAGERVHAAARAHIPHLHRVVKAARDDAVARGVEVQRHDLGSVTCPRHKYVYPLPYWQVHV